ncbi:hypothetical protein BN133_2262 [Cronobacter dublinensis 582]|nr:hypothetical protein BN133_2262 [Cronobacter dublinensis 582]
MVESERKEEASEEKNAGAAHGKLGRRGDKQRNQRRSRYR